MNNIRTNLIQQNKENLEKYKNVIKNHISEKAFNLSTFKYAKNFNKKGTMYIEIKRKSYKNSYLWNESKWRLEINKPILIYGNFSFFFIIDKKKLALICEKCTNRIEVADTSQGIYFYQDELSECLVKHINIIPQTEQQGFGF